MYLLKANAALHLYQRPKDAKGRIVVTVDDVRDVLQDFKEITPATILGVSEDALGLAKAFQVKMDFTFRDIMAKTRELFCEVPESTIRELYTKRLVELSFWVEDDDSKDGRKKVYSSADKPTTTDVFDNESELFREVKEKYSSNRGDNP